MTSPKRRPVTAPISAELTASGGVTTLELFFDLVFVFAVTQLTGLVRHGHGAGHLVSAALILIVLWWMYDGFAWLTNNVSVQGTGRRLLFLMAMAAFMIIAVAVPDAFGHDGVIFGVAYLALVLTHAGMFTLAQTGSARAIWGILPFNLGCALLVLAAGWVTGTGDWVLWGAAVAVLAAAMMRRAETGFDLRPAHFAERHGLIVIIALGESVVGIGVGADGRLHETAVVGTALLALALAAAMWWLYFDRDDEAGARALGGMNTDGRTRRALFAYSLGVLVLVGGIVLAAAGLETAVAQPHGPLEPWAAWTLACGVAVYLLGLGAFRRLLGLDRAWLRPAAAPLALVGVVAGRSVNGALEIAVITAVLAALAVADRTHMRLTGQPDPGLRPGG